MLDLLVTLITWVSILTILIAVYTLSQLAVGELLRCRVMRMQVGVGPLLATFTLGRTTFTLRAFALGSEMQFFGSGLADIHRPMGEQPLIRRVLIIAAGPAALLVVSWFSISLALACYGVRIPSSTTMVGNVIEGEPAAKAGIVQGDVVLAVDGQPLADWDALAQAIRSRTDQPFSLTVIRNGASHTLSVTPSKETHSSSESLLVSESSMGLQRASHQAQVGLRLALLFGAKATASVVVGFLRMFPQMISGHVTSRDVVLSIIPLEKRQRSKIQPLFYSFAGFAIGFAVLNLLPLPSLSGGILLQALLEALQGRPITRRQAEFARRVGLLVLASLMLWVLAHDISTFYRNVIQRLFLNW